MRYQRLLWNMLYDAALAGLCFALAAGLRLGGAVAEAHDYLALGALVSVVCAVLVHAVCNPVREDWQHVSVQSLLRVVGTSFSTIAFTYGVLWLALARYEIPTTLPFIQWLLLVVAATLPRAAYRALMQQDAPEAVADHGPRIPVLLLGVHADAEDFIAQTQLASNTEGFEVVGIVSADATRIGERVLGVPIYGPAQALDRVLTKLGQKQQFPQRVVLSNANADVSERLFWLEHASAAGIVLQALEAESSGVMQQLHPKPMPLESVIAPHQTSFDGASMGAWLRGKRVLITGAGGTLGTELARQIVGYGPAALTLLDISEHALADAEQAMLRIAPDDVPVYCMLGDVRDRLRLEQVFGFQTPEIVIHAAAIKHVPLAERDCEEAILTNVFGVQHVAECSMQFGAQVMVSISSDSAVEPSNVLGATQRLGERYLYWLSQQATQFEGSAPCFTSVRLGNVLASSGSVVGVFEQQLAHAEPITVSHPDMSRYFVSVADAASHVLQAGAWSSANQSQALGSICVPDMGDPVAIELLARRMIQLAGLEPGVDVQIRYSGQRAGEKIHQVRYYEAEQVQETSHAMLQIARMPLQLDELPEYLVQLHDACLNRDRETAFGLLQHLVPEYVPYGWSQQAA